MSSKEDPFTGLFDDLRAEAEDRIAQAVDEVGQKTLRAAIRLGDAFFNNKLPKGRAPQLPTKGGRRALTPKR